MGFFILFLSKVHLKSNFLMNGVCVTFKGIMDLQRLDGTAYLEHDQVQAKVSFLSIV